MSVRAVAASGEKVINTDTYVSSNLGSPTQVYLPKINDGSAGSVAVDAAIRFETTAGSPLELLTQSGRLIGTVPPRSQGTAVARTGTVQGEPDGWNFDVDLQTPSTFLAPGAAYAQADSVAIVACLVKHGLMKAE